MWDGARQLKEKVDDKITTIPIDIKTVCKATSGNGIHTRGVISIPPSPNKVWIKPLGIYDPNIMPSKRKLGCLMITVCVSLAFP